MRISVFYLLRASVFAGCIAILFGAYACNAAKKPQAQTVDSLQTSGSEQQPEPIIPLPAIPSVLQGPEARAGYLVNHFWDLMNFADTSYLQTPDRLEVSFANFIGILQTLPINTVKNALIKPVENSAVPLQRFFLKMYEKYLYDPNSPMRNEEYYIPVLTWAVASPKVDMATQVRLKNRLDLALRNRVGHRAEDFTYITADNVEHRLTGLNAKYTLLFFFTPGCKSCESAIGEMKQLPIFASYAGTSMLAVLFIDAEGNRESWLSGTGLLPAYGINGLDEKTEILNKQLYDLKASPTIYLLDSEKTVLLKDTPLDRVAAYLDEHLQKSL